MSVAAGQPLPPRLSDTSGMLDRGPRPRLGNKRCDLAPEIRPRLLLRSGELAKLRVVPHASQHWIRDHGLEPVRQRRAVRARQPRSGQKTSSRQRAPPATNRRACSRNDARCAALSPPRILADAAARLRRGARGVVAAGPVKLTRLRGLRVERLGIQVRPPAPCAGRRCRRRSRRVARRESRGCSLPDSSAATFGRTACTASRRQDLVEPVVGATSCAPDPSRGRAAPSGGCAGTRSCVLRPAAQGASARIRCGSGPRTVEGSPFSEATAPSKSPTRYLPSACATRK